MSKALLESAAAVCILASLLFVTGVSAEPTSPPRLRLYVLDCGAIGPMDPKSFGLSTQEFGGAQVQLASPCYLIVHPEGTMLWETGQIADADVPGDGAEVRQRGASEHRDA